MEMDNGGSWISIDESEDCEVFVPGYMDEPEIDSLMIKYEGTVYEARIKGQEYEVRTFGNFRSQSSYLEQGSETEVAEILEEEFLETRKNLVQND
ncbi:MAG: hypothetical protein ABEJ56_00410 [Candidatus Nanohaloarchaea archaeon]